jgi:hypothetical protein
MRLALFRPVGSTRKMGRSQEVSSLTDDPRTEQQLRAEIAALKKRIDQQGAGEGALRHAKRATKRATRPAAQTSLIPFPVHVPVTRRASFAMWLAPAILLAPALKRAKQLAKTVKRRVLA